MITKVLYEFSILEDNDYDYITSFEADYSPSVGADWVRKWMRSKFVKELLKQGIIVDKIKELC